MSEVYDTNIGDARFKAAMQTMTPEQMWAIRVIFSAERSVRHQYPASVIDDPVGVAYAVACQKIR